MSLYLVFALRTKIKLDNNLRNLNRTYSNEGLKWESRPIQGPEDTAHYSTPTSRAPPRRPPRRRSQPLLVDSKLGSGESRRRITAAAAARRFDLRSRHLAARIPMARLHWLEAMLPLGIIGGMLCIMGNAQYYIHRAAHGRVRASSSSPFRLRLHLIREPLAF